VLEPLRGFYPDLADGVLAHHERWDGKGYPRAQGRRIPLAARVVADRRHLRRAHARPPLSRRDSRRRRAQVLLDGRGTQFDPDFVDLFLFPPVFDRC
jgi:response regulator RpfG family c-di-GMP phosphodiesterase